MLMTPSVYANALPVNIYRDDSNKTQGGGIWSSMRLETESGWKKASDIVAGDQVLTLDNGLRTVWNVQRKRLDVRTDALPLVVAAGTAGNSREFLVPEKQVVMVESDQAEQLTGSRYALICASDLIGYMGVSRIVPPEEFEVVSLEFQNDEIVCAANGSLLLAAGSCQPENSDDLSLQNPRYRVLSSELATSLISKTVPEIQTSAWNNGIDAQVGCRCVDRV